MSILVMSWIWEHSSASGSDLLMLLAIADHAHDDGTGAFPSMARLAQRTRLDERTVRRLTGKLAKEGHLEIQYNKGPNRVNLYSIPGGGHVVPLKPREGDISGSEGDTRVRGRGTRVSPGIINEPSIEPNTRAREADPEPIADFQANLTHLYEARRTATPSRSRRRTSPTSAGVVIHFTAVGDYWS